MDTLREKMGPLPVWAWLALITAAGLGWWLLSRRKASANTTTGSTTADVPQSVIQTTINEPPEPMERERDRDRDRRARKHKHARKDPDREEDRESDRTEDREEKSARHKSKPDWDPGRHLYRPPGGRGPTNHTPQQRRAA